MGTIADGNVIEADDVLSSMRTTVEAGESITIGKACYIKESDGKAYLSDKSSAPYFTGIAFAGVDSGADVTLVTKGKFVTTGLVDKEVYYLGSSGAISTTLSSVRIGTADGTTDLYIDTSLYNQGGAGPIHKVAFSDATGRTGPASSAFADSLTAFDLVVPGGCVVVGGNFRASVSSTHATSRGAGQLKVTGSTITTTYGRTERQNNVDGGYQQIWDAVSGTAGTWGSFFIHSTTYYVCSWSVPYPLICPDDTTTFTVQVGSNNTNAGRLKDVTLELWYQKIYVDDDA